MRSGNPYSTMLSISVVMLMAIVSSDCCAQDITVDQAPQLYDTCIEELPHVSQDQINALASSSHNLEELAHKAVATCDAEKSLFVKYLITQGLSQKQAIDRVEGISVKAEELVRTEFLGLVFAKYAKKGLDLMRRSQ